MLPTKLQFRSPWVKSYTKEGQEKLRVDDINLLEEYHDQAFIRAAKYQQALRRYHSKKIQPRKLIAGILFYEGAEIG